MLTGEKNMPYKDPIKRREKSREYSAKYRSKPGIREEKIQYIKDWRQRNIEHIRTYRNIWRSKHPDYDKAYYEEHKHQRFADGYRYKSNLHNKTLEVADNHCRNWDGTEEFFLLKNKPIMSVPELAYKLGRTNYAVLWKLRRLQHGDNSFGSK